MYISARMACQLVDDMIQSNWLCDLSTLAEIIRSPEWPGGQCAAPTLLLLPFSSLVAFLVQTALPVHPRPTVRFLSCVPQKMASCCTSRPISLFVDQMSSRTTRLMTSKRAASNETHTHNRAKGWPLSSRELNRAIFLHYNRSVVPLPRRDTDASATFVSCWLLSKITKWGRLREIITFMTSGTTVSWC